MTTTHRSGQGPEFTPPDGVTRIPYAEYVERFPTEHDFLIARLQADAPKGYVIDAGKVGAILQLMADHGHIEFGVTADGRPHYSLVDPDSVTMSEEERAAVKGLLKIANQEGGVVLPHDAEPLTLTEFEQRFTPILRADLERHVAERLGTPQADVHDVLEMASRGGPGQVIQFAVARGEPAVFTAPSAALSEDGRRFTDAVVSYWDTQGTYRATTGEAATAMDVLFERVLDIRRKMLFYKGYEGLKETPVAQQLTIAWLSLQLDLQPQDVFDRFVAWRETHPSSRVPSEEFFNALIPADRHVQMTRDYQEFTDYVGTGYTAKKIEEQNEELSTLSVYSQNIDRAVKTHIESAKINADRLEQAWLAIKDSTDVPVVEQADRLIKIKAELVAAQHDLQVLKDFADADPELHTLVAQTLVGSETQTKTFMDAYTLIARQFPDEGPVQLTDRTFGAIEFKPPSATLDEWLDERPQAIARISRECTASPRVVREILDRWVGAGVLKFAKIPPKPGDKSHLIAGVLSEGWPEATSRTERLMQKVFRETFGVRTAEELERPGVVAEDLQKLKNTQGTPFEGLPLDEVIWARNSAHSYMRAVEAQYGVLADLIFASNKAKSEGKTSIYGMSLLELFDDDVDGLKRAETYCWFEEPILAVEAAAATLPDSVRLTRDLTEHYAAWWYFTMPQDVRTLPTDEPVQALLWHWHGPDLRFSTYVRTAEHRTMPSGFWPTTRFSWHEGETLAKALRRNRAEHHARYDGRPNTGADLTSVEHTMEAIERMLRFFIAGSLWVQQTILVRSQGHIERHARKRIEKQRAPGMPLGDIQIVHLRRKESVAEPVRTGGEKFVDWKCRWIVKGFWRNQYYPSKGIHQPKYIGSYPKGPADKPLRVHMHRINVVNR